MYNHKRAETITKALLSVGIVASLGGIWPARSQGPEPQRLFLQAKRLIEANSGDSLGATRQGLEAGIADLLKAIDAGYQDKVEAYKLLAFAYNETGLGYARRDSAERKDLLAKRDAVYRKLVEMAPRDPEVLELFADSLPEDAGEKIEAYRRVLAIAPKRVWARFSLGRLMIKQGLFQQGIQNARDAFLAAEDPTWLRFYSERLIDVLDQSCRSKIDSQVHSALSSEAFAIERLNDYEGYGETLRLAMKQFKQNFVDVLDRFKCQK